MLVPEWVYDESPIDDPFGYGQQAVDWLLRLRHPANPEPGKPFQLSPWQRRVIKRIYGPRYVEDARDKDTGILLHRKGDRIIRKVYIRIPRGARKTSLGAAIVFLHLFGPEKTPGGRIIGAASAHKQALELFNEASLVIKNDKRLKRLRVYGGSKTSILYPEGNSSYRAVSSDGKSLHGLTWNACVLDESHTFETNKHRELWEALDSASVKIRNTLMVITTTAGEGTETTGWHLDQRAVRIQKGLEIDESFLPIVFGLEPEDGEAWHEPETWLKLNPGMRDGYPDISGYRIKANEAKQSPSAAYAFKMYNLCLWQEAAVCAFIDPEIYDKGAREIPDDINGLDCWIGCDFSRTTDLSAIVACVKREDEYVLLPYFFCPAEDIEKRGNIDGVNYREWSEAGLITATPGPTVDYEALKSCISGLCERFNVRSIGFDKAYASPVMNPLTADGLPTAIVEQGYQTQSRMLNALEKAFIDGKVIHGGNPALRWCFMNVAIKVLDDNGNRKMSKKGSESSKKRIDGAAASWMALGQAAEVQSTSFYERDDWSPDMAFI